MVTIMGSNYKSITNVVKTSNPINLSTRTVQVTSPNFSLCSNATLGSYSWVNSMAIAASLVNYLSSTFSELFTIKGFSGLTSVAC
jgi:hypothetical protein